MGYVGYWVRKVAVSKGERGMMAYRGIMGAAAVACVALFAFTFLCWAELPPLHLHAARGYDLAEEGAIRPSARRSS